MAIGLIAGVSVYAGAKWAFYNPPYGHAVVLYHTGVILLAILLLRFWAWPRIRHPLTLHGMATRLEKGDPHLHDCLSCALEFSNPDPILAECLEPSERLLDGFYQDALETVQGKKRVRWIVPYYFWALAILSVGFTAFWFSINWIEPFTWDDALTLYRLNFLQNPYRPLHQLVVEPGYADALTGDSVTVRTSLLGPGFFSGSITYNMVGFPEQSVEMKTLETNANSFEYKFENLQGDLRYKVHVGPLESVEYLVKVQSPAELVSVQLTYHYPEFMGGRVEVIPPGQGAAIAPKGATVEVATRWNRPMKEVFLSFNGGAHIQFHESSANWRGSFILESGGSYILGGASQDGVPLRGDLEFPVQMLVDLPPEIQLISPKEDVDYSLRKPKGKIPLQFRATDDVGIQSLFLYAGAPGVATQTHQIAQLDGKEKEVEETFLFDWRPWQREPVCRIYLEAVDNHPDVAGKKRTPTRRFYFQAPGSFDEVDKATKEERVKADPFEFTAYRLVFLLLRQTDQNNQIPGEGNAPPADLDKWKARETRLLQLTAQTSLEARENAEKLKRGPAAKAGPPAAATGENSSNKENPDKKIADLPVRLEQVSERLGGAKVSIDDLIAHPSPGGATVVDRQSRQLDAVQTNFPRRGREEGDRAAKELAKAYQDLTGREPPIAAEAFEAQIAKATKEAQQAVKEQKEKSKEESAAAKGEKAGAAKQAKGGKDRAAKKGGKDEEDGLEAGSKKKGVAGKEKVGGMGGPSLATNKYMASEFKLDPSTVHLETPQVQLMNKALSTEMEKSDLTEYTQKPIPAEYAGAAAEYTKILLGQ
jgi:hypothetical protein